tara:strand:- start:82 stop:261 length:180 start_codon:yes stop_codon:yes gene_type:complete
MSELQWYVYLIGFFFFFLGVYFYYQKRKDEINEKQKIFRNRAMYIFLTIAIICVGYSWI